MKDFLPHITNDQGQSLHVVGSAIVQTSIPNPIDDAPEGWEKSTIQYSRHPEMYALFKSYTTPLKFVLEGAYILRYMFYTFGMEIVLYFIWLKLDATLGGTLTHKSWYKGEPDLSTFKDSDDGVECVINESGFFKDLNANKSIVYEYKLKDDPRAVTVEISGVPIANTAAYIVADQFDYNVDSFTPICVFSTNEGTNFVLDLQGQDYEQIPGVVSGGGGYMETSNNYLFKNKSAQVQTVHATGNLIVKCTQQGSGAPHFARLMMYKESDVFPFPADIMNHSFDDQETVVRAIDQTFVLQPGEKVFFLGIMQAANLSVFKIEFIDGSKIFLDFKSIKPVTIHNALRAVDLGRNICESMSGGLSTMESDLLDNDPNLLITSGDAVRGIEDAVVKTKWTDYHTSINAVRCISFGVANQNGKLETRRYGFQNIQIANLGLSSNLELTTANEFIYDSIENGYPVTDIEDVNGRYMFCNTCIYKLPGRRVKNTYDIKSIYLADPYVIELTRINLENKRTTDANTDNKVFFLDAEKVYNDITADMIFYNDLVFNFGSFRVLNRTGLGLIPGIRFTIPSGQNTGSYSISAVYEDGADTVILLYNGVLFNFTGAENGITITFNHYRMRRLAYTNIEGFPTDVGPLVYNMELSPATILKFHYPWIYSSCEFMDGQYIVFQSTDKNDKVSREYNGVITRERKDILINGATLGQKIYRPYYFDANFETPISLSETMDAGVMGFFAFDTYRGYPMDIKTNDATMETQEYKLLCTGDTDLLNRITQN